MNTKMTTYDVCVYIIKLTFDIYLFVFGLPFRLTSLTFTNLNMSSKTNIDLYTAGMDKSSDCRGKHQD